MIQNKSAKVKPTKHVIQLVHKSTLKQKHEHIT